MVRVRTDGEGEEGGKSEHVCMYVCVCMCVYICVCILVYSYITRGGGWELGGVTTVQTSGGGRER